METISIEKKKSDLMKSLGQTMYDLYKWLVSERWDFDNHISNLIKEEWKPTDELENLNTENASTVTVY
jgi:protease II